VQFQLSCMSFFNICCLILLNLQASSILSKTDVGHYSDICVFFFLFNLFTKFILIKLTSPVSVFSVLDFIHRGSQLPSLEKKGGLW
jgi:hypothetical protein